MSDDAPGVESSEQDGALPVTAATSAAMAVSLTAPSKMVRPA